MRTGFRSTTEPNSLVKRLAGYLVGFAVGAGVVFALGLHGGVLRIVFFVVAIPVALVTSLLLNTRRMTSKELESFEQEMHDVPLHDVKLPHVELKFGEIHTKEHDE